MTLGHSKQGCCRPTWLNGLDRVEKRQISGADAHFCLRTLVSWNHSGVEGRAIHFCQGALAALAERLEGQGGHASSGLELVNLVLPAAACATANGAATFLQNSFQCV